MTESTIQAAFDRVEPYLNPLLMTKSSLREIRQVASALPAFAVNFFGFETRLGDELAATDCAFNLTADGARMLAGQHSVPPPAALEALTGPEVRKFFQAWGESSAKPFVGPGATWLEFDSGTGGAGANLLFGYWHERPNSSQPLGWLTDTLLPLVLPAPLSPGLLRSLSRAFDVCPPGTNDFQIGVMVRRHLPVVRLCVFDIPVEGVGSYLDRLGWDGPRGDANDLLAALAPHADFVGLHLDIGEQLYPHLGIEPGFRAGPWARQPHLEPRWHRQFEALVQRGLCLPEKRDALLAWVGHQRGGVNDAQVTLRGLSHLKVTLRPGARPLAKAYFGITLRDAGHHERPGVSS